MIKFTPVIQDVREVPAGKYIAYLDDQEPAILEVMTIQNGTLALVNGHFHFDRKEKVIAYAPFPELKF